jgi:hypothetical protein
LLPLREALALGRSEGRFSCCCGGCDRCELRAAPAAPALLRWARRRGKVDNLLHVLPVLPNLLNLLNLLVCLVLVLIQVLAIVLASALVRAVNDHNLGARAARRRGGIASRGGSGGGRGGAGALARLFAIDLHSCEVQFPICWPTSEVGTRRVVQILPAQR